MAQIPLYAYATPAGMRLTFAPEGTFRRTIVNVIEAPPGSEVISRKHRKFLRVPKPNGRDFFEFTPGMAKGMAYSRAYGLRFTDRRP